MGGPGSGNWCQTGKTTVEESLSLAIAGFRGQIHPHSAGTVTWTRAGRVTNSTGFAVTWDPGPTLTLRYRRSETEIQIPIRLDVTYPALGGQRWWFICPLVVAGVPCNRRAAKLFLPPGAQYFGCRHCHRLTYRSCQEAHKLERVFVMMDSFCRKHGISADLSASYAGWKAVK
jgi:hypothetical protein